MIRATSSQLAEKALSAAWHGLGALALAATPFAAAWELLHGRTLQPLSERLGASPRARGAAWIAAASAGEVAVARPLLALAHRQGLGPLVLSVGTRHGRLAAARDAARLEAPPFHPPLDALPCVRRSLGRLHPRLLVTVETEIWPNLFRACARRRIPVAVVNARLSPSSFPRYRRARALIAASLAEVALVAARTSEDADRWRELGAPPGAVHVAGNVKFDAALEAAREPDLAWARAAGLLDPPWLVFGSTAAGEEGVLLEAFARALPRWPTLRAVLAPKRPDRWPEVARLVRERGLPLVCRSSFGSSERDPPVPPGGILLLDTTGELARVYRHARLAFVGGSLVPHGGQNLLEPAASGVPVVFGRHVANFRDAEAALLERGGGRRADPGTIAEVMMDILADEDRRARMAGAARDAVLRHEGATARTLDLLRPLLAPASAASW